MTSRRRPRRGRRLFVVILLLALCGGGWWWLRSDDDGGSAEPPVTREPTVPAVVDMTPAKTPAKKSLDPVTGDRDVALGSRGSNRIGETSPSNADDPADSDDPVTASLPAPEKSDPKPEPEPVAGGESTEPAPTPAETVDETTTDSKTETGSRLSNAMAARNMAVAQLAEAGTLADRDPVAARKALGKAWSGGLSEDDRARAAALSRTLADRTIFMGPSVPVSPWTRTYTIRPSDTLGGIIYGQKVATSQSFIARINGLDDPNAIRANRPLLLPNGRFHAVVDLDSRDLAVFQEIDDGSRDLLIVMPIALGPDLEAGIDPDRDRVTGVYRVRPQGMRRNPSWRNPATGRMWSRGDVGNPVGEHWISLEAIDQIDEADATRPPVVLHGTTEDHPIESGLHPGLIALEPRDIEWLYLMLDTGDSTVDVRR